MKEVTTDNTETQRIISDAGNNYTAVNWETCKNKLVDSYNLPRLNKEEAENLNKPVTCKEIELVIKSL